MLAFYRFFQFFSALFRCRRFPHKEQTSLCYWTINSTILLFCCVLAKQQHKTEWRKVIALLPAEQSTLEYAGFYAFELCITSNTKNALMMMKKAKEEAEKKKKKRKIIYFNCLSSRFFCTLSSVFASLCSLFASECSRFFSFASFSLDFWIDCFNGNYIHSSLKVEWWFRVKVGWTDWQGIRIQPNAEMLLIVLNPKNIGLLTLFSQFVKCLILH